MQCYVFASSRKADTYLWLTERDGTGTLPASLAELLGELRFVLELDLQPQRELPHEDSTLVLTRLREQGWYLQLRPGERG